MKRTSQFGVETVKARVLTRLRSRTRVSLWIEETIPELYVLSLFERALVLRPSWVG